MGRQNLPQEPLVSEILSRLGAELKEPRITQDLELVMTDKDFDNRKVSIVDNSDHRIVTKVAEDDLSDYDTTPEVRRALDGQLRQALRAHYATKKEAS